ncbi:glycoside hydrolase family 76 protein [Pedobacter sp. SYP-B3415]|uniref:glycoside hydrolase family 76 protein n=1 Tax=Pedobacter sp. SYP-B3415 TaxID=2496641 RepID=UPI00101DD772|nr:glycoside hydrolase family 76 protein [Pedobacter sp. SYP-B3415]
MKTIKILAVLLILIGQTGFAQKTDYKERINLIRKNIQTVFYEPESGLYFEKDQVKARERKYSFLWPLCALMDGANEVDVLKLGTPYLPGVMKAIERYDAKDEAIPGYRSYLADAGRDSRFYDDNQWLGITAAENYVRTKDKRYLELAKKIYLFMMSGYDEKAGGGLYWQEDKKDTKNTCSNGPGVLVALKLYQITKEKKYLDTAVLLYNWTKKNLQDTDGLYFDNVRIPSLEVDKRKYTYNTGTMINSAAILYQLTKDKTYLEEARHVAAAGKAFFYKDGKLPGHYWFNVVMLRGYLELHKIDKNPAHLDFFIKDAERVWNTERDSNGLIGRQKVKSLIDQAAMLEFYARLAQL